MNATVTKPEAKTENNNGHGADGASFLTPPANIREDEDGYLLEAEMPGVSKDGLSITVEKGELVILGRRRATEAPGTRVYRESCDADYRRVFELDPSIDASKITAKIEQGVLRLHLPKAEAVKPRQISIAD